MMDFIPKQVEPSGVPFFDEVTKGEGWQGHSTSKSLSALKAEVAIAITRLGGIVTSFQRGTFHVAKKEREGYRVRYSIEHPSGAVLGQLDVAALPVKSELRRQRSYGSRREKSLRMALYMLRNALDGLWFLQQLSPGYAALMPWMLNEASGMTISELWNEAGLSGSLLPPGEEFVEGEFDEV